MEPLRRDEDPAVNLAVGLTLEGLAAVGILVGLLRPLGVPRDAWLGIAAMSATFFPRFWPSKPIPLALLLLVYCGMNGQGDSLTTRGVVL